MIPNPLHWLTVFLLTLCLLVQSVQPVIRRRHRRRYGTSIFTSSSGSCEPVRLELCRRTMPYGRTRMPNLLHHATQRNARLVLEQYQSLIDTRCGVETTHKQDHLVFYLCAVFAPLCPAGGWKFHWLCFRFYAASIAWDAESRSMCQTSIQ